MRSVPFALALTLTQTLTPTLTLTLTLLAGALAAQDSVQLRDGRFVLDQKMTRTDKGVTIHFKSGDVFLPDAMIQSTTARDKSGGARKVSAKDQAKIDKGLVFFNGRWMSKKAADRAREKVKAVRVAKIKEAKLHRKWAKRYITKTKNFQFEYTIDPVVMKDYSNMMETYYKVFTKEWKIRKPSKMGRLVVCFYHDREYFNQVGGAGAGVLGYFRFIAPIELNFFYDRANEKFTQHVMFHETNHYLTYLIDPKFKYPIWVNEGLAEYYGASKWDPKRKKMTTGHMCEGRIAEIREILKLNRRNKGTGSAGDAPKWLTIEDLAKVPHRGFGSRYYAWAWSFMHFIFHGQNKKYASKFKKFYMALAKDKSIRRVPLGGTHMKTIEPDEVIKAMVKYLDIKDMKEFNRQWHDYIRGLKEVSHVGKYEAGWNALMHNMPIKAQRLFKEAIAMGSKNPMTWYYLGQAQMRKGKYSEAEESFKKYLTMDPLNGMAYINLARCKARDQFGRKSEDPEVRRLRRLALEVDPDNYSVVQETAWDEAGDGGGK